MTKKLKEEYIPGVLAQVKTGEGCLMLYVVVDEKDLRLILQETFLASEIWIKPKTMKPITLKMYKSLTEGLKVKKKRRKKK